MEPVLTIPRSAGTPVPPGFRAQDLFGAAYFRRTFGVLSAHWQRGRRSGRPRRCLGPGLLSPGSPARGAGRRPTPPPCGPAEMQTLQRPAAPPPPPCFADPARLARRYRGTAGRRTARPGTAGRRRGVVRSRPRRPLVGGFGCPISVLFPSCFSVHDPPKPPVGLFLPVGPVRCWGRADRAVTPGGEVRHRAWRVRGRAGQRCRDTGGFTGGPGLLSWGTRRAREG